MGFQYMGFSGNTDQRLCSVFVNLGSPWKKSPQPDVKCLLQLHTLYMLSKLKCSLA